MRPWIGKRPQSDAGGSREGSTAKRAGGEKKSSANSRQRRAEPPAGGKKKHVHEDVRRASRILTQSTRLRRKSPRRPGRKSPRTSVRTGRRCPNVTSTRTTNSSRRLGVDSQQESPQALSGK